MARIAYARQFDGVDDQIQFTLGGLAGAWSDATVAAIIKTPTGTNPGYDGAFFGISGTLNFSHNRSSGLLDFYDYSTFQSWENEPTVTLDEWWLVAYTKVTGSVAPHRHTYRYSNSVANHNTAFSAQPNLPSPGATVRAGSNEFSQFYTGTIACIGVWKSTALADADFVSLASGIAAWRALSPTSLWLFNQPSTAQTVSDIVGTSPQSSITGTTVVSISDLAFDVPALTATAFLGWLDRGA